MSTGPELRISAPLLASMKSPTSSSSVATAFPEAALEVADEEPVENGRRLGASVRGRDATAVPVRPWLASSWGGFGIETCMPAPGGTTSTQPKPFTFEVPR